ncbi:MAG: polysaccharide biosynthesis C-terminal domain-containing protein [Cyclobacteriaceae bacterium]
MGIVKRQSIKSAVYVYLGVGLGYLTRAKLFPEYLTEAEIGVLALLVTYASIFAQIATLGFNQAVIKHFPIFRHEEKKHHGFLSIQLALALVGFLIIWIAFPVLEVLILDFRPSPILEEYFHLTLILTFVILLFNVVDTYNVVLFNSTTGIFLREFALKVLMLVAFIPLIYAKINFDRYAVYYVCGYALIAFLLIMYTLASGQLHLKPNFQLFDRDLVRKMVSISLFGLIMGFGNIAIISIDNIMINWYFDEAATGIYATNFLFAILVLMPSRGVNRIAPAVISDAFNDNRLQDIKELQSKSSLNQLIVSLFIFMGLAINMENIYQILPASYRAGYWVILFIGLANIIKMGGGVSTAVIGFSDHYKFNTYFMALLLGLLIMTNILFIPIYGIMGAALASLVSVTIFEAVKFMFLKFKYGIQPYSLRHLKAIMVAVTAGGIVYFIPVINPFLIDILVRGAVFSLLFIPAIYYLYISEDINKIIDNLAGFLKGKN